MTASIPGDPLMRKGALTADERGRINVLLAAVSTRTLLHSLDRLTSDNEDARLIIAALLDRFPDHGPYDPVMPR